MSSFLNLFAAPGPGGRRRFGPALALALLGSAGAAQAQGARPAQIAAVPAVVRLSAGDSAQATVVDVKNEGGAPAQLRFYLGDFEQNEDGDFTFPPYGQGAHSCGARLSAYPDGIVLRPGERQQVQLRLQPGAGVCWALLFVESLPEGLGPIKTVQRIGVKILNAPGKAAINGEVSAVTVQRLRGDTIGVRTVFSNTGQAPLDLKGRVEIRDYSGKVLGASEFGPLGSLPGRTRAFEVAIPVKLTRGEYLAVPIVDFGGDYLAGGQATIKVP